MSRKKTAAEKLAERSKNRGTETLTASQLAQKHIVHTPTGPSVSFASIGEFPLHFLRDELQADAEQGFAEAFALFGMSRKKRMVSDFRYRLIGGFFTYLALKRTSAESSDGHGAIDRRRALCDLDEDMLVDFKRMLDDKNSSLHSPSETTRANKIYAVQTLLKLLRASEDWRDKLSPDLRFFENPYPAQRHKIEHRKPVKDITFDELYAFAAAECEAFMASYDASCATMAAMNGSAMTLEDASKSAEALAVYMSARHPHPIPPHYRVADHDAKFAALIDLELYHRAQRLLYPSLRELVPFILVIASVFALNSGVVLGMKVSDFKIRNVLGTRRLRIFPFKPRANRRQRIEIAITPDPDNPGNLFPWLVKRCALARGMLEVSNRQDLFARLSLGMNRARPVAGDMSAWNDAMVDFEVAHKLRTAPPTGSRPIPEIKLSQIRVTALDRVHELTGGDMVVVQATAVHMDMNTSEEFYRTAGMTMRNQEKLGDAMQKRHRAIRTGGKVDNSDRPADVDDAAATPGFKCADPYYQEVDRQGDNELCGAYGQCPSCIMGFVDYSSVTACALLHQLRERIDEAQRDDPRRWLTHWAKEKRALLLHLARFPDEAHESVATVIAPTLPPVE